MLPVADTLLMPVVHVPMSPRSFCWKICVPTPPTFCGRFCRAQVSELESWASNEASALSTPRKGSVSLIAGS